MGWPRSRRCCTSSRTGERRGRRGAWKDSGRGHSGGNRAQTEPPFLLRQYWRMSGTGAGPLEGPLRIQSTWPDLPDVIDTAFQDPLTKKLFFFSGEAPSPPKGPSRGRSWASGSPLPLPLQRG